MTPRHTTATLCAVLITIACSGLVLNWASKEAFPPGGQDTDGASLAPAHEQELAKLRSQIRGHEDWERSLMADKRDLLMKLAAAEAERDDLKQRAYLTESILATQRTAIMDRNNPFHRSDVRKECGFDDGLNLEEFLARASELVGRQTELDGLPSGSSRAVLSMLLVSGIFEFGRSAPNDGLSGCVSDSVRGIKGEGELIRFEDYQRAPFACCVDFSVLLIELLRHQNIPCELRVSQGHAVVEAELDQSGPLLLDPSFCLAVRGIDTRSTEQLVIYRFPAKDNSRKVALQFQIVFGLIFSLEGMRADDLVRVDYRDFCRQYRIQIGGSQVGSD
jgi:hypothetical protein